MKKLSIATSLLAALFAINANAATFHLKDGRSLEGELLSQQDGVLIIDMQGIEVKLPKAQVASVDMGTATSTTAEPSTAKSADTAQASQQQNAPSESAQELVVPAGTELLVKTEESLNTRQHQSGQRFSAVLEADLVVDDVTVAPRGSQVYGVLTQVNKAGRMAGSASMSLQLESILIDGQRHTLSTDTLSSEGGNTAKNTLGKTARAAAIGGLIDGSDGAKTGAKVGVGASILTQGNDIELPRGALIDFTLVKPLEV